MLGASSFVYGYLQNGIYCCSFTDMPWSMRRVSHKRKCYLDKRAGRFAGPKPATILALRRRRRLLRQLRRTIIHIHAPKRFNVREDHPRHALLLFFEYIDACLSEGKFVKIRFGKVEELHPCGTLVFMARLDGWLSEHSGKLSCDYPDDDVVEQLFQHVGVLGRLGLPSRKVISHEKVAFWHYHSGLSADPSSFKDLTASVIAQIDHPNQPLFGDCLNEAICNTVGHAYTHISDLAAEQRKWWIFSQYREGRVFVAIYDQGEGIPSSLRRKPEWIEYLKVRHYRDDRIIQSAIVSNRTNTRQPERGKGLPEMLEFSRELRGGGLMILSSRGGFEYNAETSRTLRRRYTARLPGTMVQWSIPFRKEQGNGNNEYLDS